MLRLLRESLALKQDKVAQQAGISPSYLCLLESGKKEASNDVLTKLARIYGVPVHCLLWDEEAIENAKTPEEKALFERMNNVMKDLLVLVMQRNEKRA